MSGVGKVYLVGGGPGDPGLLTLRAKEVLQKADVILYDALINPQILEWSLKAKKIYVGKRGGKGSITQDQVEDLMVQETKKGSQVVRLKGGDPFIFGRGAEEALTLVSNGIPWEVVPGVSSATAVPAYAGIPLSMRHVNATIGFVTGHEDPDKELSQIDWPGLSRMGTLVFLMAVKQLAFIVEKLIQSGRSADTPCALIRWGTLSHQKTVTANLNSILIKVEDEQMRPPCIFVVGEVAGLRDKLKWFDEKPLFGKSIVVTRARDQASSFREKLDSLGAQVLSLPTIEIIDPLSWTPIDQAIADIENFNWIIFTSVNGVRRFIERLDFLDLDIRALYGLKIAAIGEATKEELSKMKLRVDLCPQEFVAEGLLESFKERGDMKGQKVLLPRAESAREVLVQGLRGMGADVTPLSLYRTKMASNYNEDVEEDLRNVDWLTFTSSSTVKHFKEKYQSFDAKVASIGPITSQTLKEFGFQVTVEAREYTIDGLIDAILKHEQSA